MSKIGVWNTAFLGDAVLTLPLLQTLKANFPQAELHYFVREGLQSLFQAQPELAEVHGFDKRGRDRSLLAAHLFARKLARQGFSMWVSAHRSFRSGVIARGTGARTRIGYTRPWFNHYFYTHTVSRNFGQRHEVERLLRLAEPLNLPTRVDWPRLVLPERARERADGFWAEHIRGPVLGLHPGSTWATKRWPAERFGQLALRVVEAGGQIILFGGPGERELVRQVEKAIADPLPPAVLNLAGMHDLSELAAWIARLDAYLCNDSGPMHLAWIQRVPLVALFGPTVQRFGFAPLGENATVIERDLDCRPCSLHGPQTCPKGHHRCMLDISVDGTPLWKH